MPDRKISPELKEIDQIDFVEPKRYRISEHLELFHMAEVANETTRFDLYFDAGKIRNPEGLPSFVNGLLLSGTSDKNAIAIQEEINGMGAFYESGVSMESAAISVYCLREKALDLFHTITSALEGVIFDQKEVSEYLADRKQSHRIGMKKVSFLAQREFQKHLFASDQAYANVLEEHLFDEVKVAELKSFHKKHYLKGLIRIAVVGRLDEQEIQSIITRARSLASESAVELNPDLKNKTRYFHTEKEDALQSAIRVGRILFNKKHEDYLDFLILNTLLGDYFGSRLMSNIREDKGYTYGIGSAVAEFMESGYFVIATEVGKKVKDAAINEIRLELEKLQNELVPEYELELVKSYMLGQLLKSADGPYAMMDLFLSAEVNGCSLDIYNRSIDSIRTITPERIRQLAIKYLNWEEMTVVSAG